MKFIISQMSPENTLIKQRASASIDLCSIICDFTHILLLTISSPLLLSLCEGKQAKEYRVHFGICNEVLKAEPCN